MRSFLYLICIMLLFSSCFSKKDILSVTKESGNENSIIDLNASANIIMQLIIQQRLGEMIENITTDEMQQCIKNTSPARIALEIEGLALDDPVILFFYTTKNVPTAIFIKDLQI